jgi:taurine dioxygenase
MSLSLKPLTATTFVAEVHGIDLAQPHEESTIQEIRDALNHHSVLVFRNQTLDPEQQIAFRLRFGDLEIHVVKQYLMPEHPEILVLSNVGAYGAKPTANGGAYWHSDISYRERPPLGSVLHGVEVPPTGGNTEFADMFGTYDALPDSRKQQLQGLRATHSYAERFRSMRQVDRSHKGENKFEVDPDKLAKEVPPVSHPVVRTHPETGRKALYVNEGFTLGIEGLPEQESRALLDELNRHATVERFVYSHRWQDGDVVFWDNRSTMHRATDYDPGYRRTMRRTTIQGDAPF